MGETARGYGSANRGLSGRKLGREGEGSDLRNGIIFFLYLFYIGFHEKDILCITLFWVAFNPSCPAQLFLLII